MTRVDEFNSFYAATSADALRVTYALCGDRQVALEATVDAYRRAWRDWTKIRDRRPLAYVRTEAWKAVALSRGTHPLRRRHEEDADTELLGALHDLATDDRRLVVLLTLGETDLAQASREVDVSEEEGIERVGVALDTLESGLGADLAALERRLVGLGAVTETLQMPPADQVRTAAKRGRRRNTILLVAASVLVVLGGGLVVTDGDGLATQASMPYREKLGAERPDVILEANKIAGDNLLTASQVADLDPEARWRTTATDEDPANTTPYATCPPQRFADDDPSRVFLRTFEADGDDENSTRVAQAIEVSGSDEEATQAYRTTMGWYANCAHPRVQLTGSFVVKRPFGDFRIMRLRSYRDPERVFTVGFTHSGSVSSTVVHEQNGAEGPEIEDFARMLNTSVAKICRDSGGQCSDEVTVADAAPPRTSDASAFLGIVDLPPISDVDRVWSGIEPFEPEEGRNPAATLCDDTAARGDSIEKALSRIFVIPQAQQLPQEFGVTETVFSMTSQKSAEDLVATVRKEVRGCEDQNLSASVGEETEIGGDDIDGSTWLVRFEVEDGEDVVYRTGIVRRGDTVAQVLFTPSGDFDISERTFDRLVTRAGERLVFPQE
ncbi:hypothetical protein ACHAAC_01965 [Aeromicrobium sp. CF4.19]|uniref:hypothetical protein n=1 Tax=Aeromicrobium sp. CF4.19 TaxID=3373082 RepID=UPI003EE42FF5